MTITEIINLITDAKCPSDIFGTEDPYKIYKQFIKLIHPDRFPDEPMNSVAVEATKKLSEFLAIIINPTSTKTNGSTNIIYEGSIASIVSIDIDGVERAVKISRNSETGLFVQNEIDTLTSLHGVSEEHQKFLVFLPKIEKTLKINGNVAFAETLLGTNYYSLEQIAELSKHNIDFRHAIWMMNRCLTLIDFSSRNGFVYGGMLPHQMMFQIADHGLVALDWSNSRKIGEYKLLYKNNKWSGMYPPEVSNKRCSPQIDLFMLMKSILWAFSDSKIPNSFYKLFNWAVVESPNSRPQSVWEFQQFIIQYAFQEYGPRRFVKLELPTT